MALPSQSARPAPAAAIGRSNMVRRKRANLRPILAAGGVVLVVAVGVWALTRPGASEGTLQSAGASQKPETPTKPIVTPAPEAPAGKVLATNPPRDPPPAVKDQPALELRQGGAKLPAPSDGASPGTLASQAGQGQVDKSVQLGGTPGAGGSAPSASPKPAPSAAPPPPAAPAAAASAFTAPADIQPTLVAAQQKQSAGDLVTARALYSRVLADGRLNETDRNSLRTELTKINDDLVFSPRVTKDDPFTEMYVVQSGDSLITIARKLALGPDYRLIARINKIVDKHRLNLGQKLKVVKGPFHAVVTKSAYRLDVYMGPADKQDQWVYIRSFRVGLGEANGTPIGTFMVKKGSKLIDPPWINPRTGEKFAGGDPKNPIGHRWVGLEGVGESAQFTGYGLHGTIDPDSIGQQRSMGCVRMGTEDIELVYELMGEGLSVVKIMP